jgi:macrolide efflux pump
MENWKKTFGIIWSGQLASILSSSVVGYAIIFWMSIETGSAEVLALAAIAGMLPQSLLGPVVGVYVDRWDRKRTMILADSFIAFCTLILAVLFWFDVAQMWHIYILLACRSVGSAFHSPSMQASVPLLAPEAQLTRVAGVNQIINSLSNIIGPALGPCSSASRASAISCFWTSPAPSSPAPRCCSYTSPIPCGAHSNRIFGGSSARDSAPSPPYREWHGSSR